MEILVDILQLEVNPGSLNITVISAAVAKEIVLVLLQWSNGNRQREKVATLTNPEPIGVLIARDWLDIDVCDA